MKKAWVSVLVVAGCVGILLVLAAASPDANYDKEKVASLVNDMHRMGPAGLADLSAIPIRPYELPHAGVDVMRAQLHETYSVDGVGTDTVALSGWIAVRHSNPYPAAGEKTITWNTAVLDTEFVAMDLHGHSNVFGDVNVALDKNRPSRGQVGKITIPEAASIMLVAKLTKNDAAPALAKADAAKGSAKAEKKAAPAAPAAPKPAEEPDAKALCEGPVNAMITMPDLKLKMMTEEPVLWYSIVDTIPPVGHTASVAIKPVRLMSNGRAVAVLQKGIVDFREVVRHVRLSDDGSATMAAKH